MSFQEFLICLTHQPLYQFCQGRKGAVCCCRTASYCRLCLHLPSLVYICYGLASLNPSISQLTRRLRMPRTESPVQLCRYRSCSACIFFLVYTSPTSHNPYSWHCYEALLVSEGPLLETGWCFTFALTLLTLVVSAIYQTNIVFPRSFVRR